MYRNLSEYHWVSDLMVALAEICEQDGQLEISAPIIRAIEEIAPLVHFDAVSEQRIYDPSAQPNVVELSQYRSHAH